LKGKNVVEKDATSNKSKVITPGMFKLDLEPLSPKVLKNRDAHIDYIKHTQENDDILQELVEHARALRPLDSDLDSACKHVQKIQELLVYITATCPSLTKPSEKLVAITPMNKNKKVRFAEPATSSSNTQKQVDSHKKQDSNKHVLPSTGMKSSTSASRSQPSGNTKKNRTSRTTSSNQKNKVEDHPRSVKYSSNKTNHVIEPVCNANVKHCMLNANSELICATCNECMFDAIHDLCVLDFVNDVNVCSKSKSAKRRASTKLGPLKENTSISVTTPNPEIKIYRRKTKVAKSVDLSSEPRTRGTNLYTLSLEDMMLSSPICLLSKVLKTKSWLWHRRLSHLNFNSITALAKQGLVRGLPKLKFQKDHLCSACALGKSKKHTHKPKAEDSVQEKLYLLHMDLYRPMRIQSINGRKYILVIVDDYSRFTWVNFLRSKDEVPEFMIKFLKVIQVRLNATVRNIITDNGTEFVNQTVRAYYKDVGISHPTSVESVVTAFYTQNWSLVGKRHNKTLNKFLHNRKPDLSYLYVFGALCYPTNDSEDLGKTRASTPDSWNNQYRTRAKPFLSNTVCPTNKERLRYFFQPMFDDYFNPSPSVVSLVPAAAASRHADQTSTPSSTTIDQDAPSSNNDPFFGVPILEPNSKESSSRDVIPTNVHSINQPSEHLRKWTKDYPLDNVIGNPSRPVSTRHQL
ncbi:retrovirus-related pol polyprotein from transposon TNT 1-94, partial [Tanacetum coccineum]